MEFRGRNRKISRLDYCQFLYATQTNYTQTYFAEHLEEVSHDAINRYLLHDKLTPKLVWEHTKDEIIFSSKGAVLFDDTVLDKNSSQTIELARWQYSGAAKKVIKGIGVVTCVYFNPDCHKFWREFITILKEIRLFIIFFKVILKNQVTSQ